MDGKFTKIKEGFKRMPYLPRLGKIRLGIKVISAKTKKEYPKEVEYFVCPPEVQKVYGETPKLLDVMFPSEDQAEVIPYCYKCYGSNQKLKCKGDGEVAVWFNPETKQMEDKECPCPELESRIVEKEAIGEKGEKRLLKVRVGPSCGKRGHLMVILPNVSLGGVYQIDTGSGANINRILDAMNYWTGMVGRCKCIPLTLERVPEKMSNPADGTMQTHYLFRFSSRVNIETLNKGIENTKKILAIEYKVEKPIEDGRLSDTPVQIIEEAEVVKEEKKEDDLTDLGLGDRHKDDPKDKQKDDSKDKQKDLKFGDKVDPKKKFKCEDCEGPVTQAEADYSRKNCGGRVLCYKCQRK